MRSKRSKRWHAWVPVREYNEALRTLTRVDPDFAFECACLGEQEIREKYTKEALRERYWRGRDLSRLIVPPVVPAIGDLMDLVYEGDGKWVVKPVVTP